MLILFFVVALLFNAEQPKDQFFTIDGIEYSTESTLLEFDGFVVVNDKVITFTDKLGYSAEEWMESFVMAFKDGVE